MVAELTELHAGWVLLFLRPFPGRDASNLSTPFRRCFLPRPCRSHTVAPVFSRPVHAHGGLVGSHPPPSGCTCRSRALVELRQILSLETGTPAYLIIFTWRVITKTYDLTTPPLHRQEPRHARQGLEKERRGGAGPERRSSRSEAKDTPATPR